MKIYYKMTSGKPTSEPFALVCLRDFTRWQGELRLKRTEYGKPTIAWPPVLAHIGFNATHCDGLIACAVSDRSAEIGLDAERVTPKASAERIAQRYYTPEEQKYIADSPDPLTAFFEVWTAKEAYIKSTGKGLSEGLNRFSVIAEGRLAPSVNGRRLLRAEIQGYICAVCIKDGDDQLEYKEMSNYV